MILKISFVSLHLYTSIVNFSNVLVIFSLIMCLFSSAVGGKPLSTCNNIDHILYNKLLLLILEISLIMSIIEEHNVTTAF